MSRQGVTSNAEPSAPSSRAGGDMRQSSFRGSVRDEKTNKSLKGSPGRSLKYTGRLEYERNEKVMPKAPERAVEARNLVRSTYTPDHLGLRPAGWTTSVQVGKNKYTREWSDWKLANTEQAHLQARPGDYAAVHQSNERFDVNDTGTLGGQQSRSITFSKEFTHGDWNQSVVVTQQERRAWDRALRDEAASATAARRAELLGGGYTGPVERQAQAMEATRARKREEQEEKRQFVDTYGAGWQQMLEGTRRWAERPRAPRRLRPKQPLRKADADALAELDRFSPPKARGVLGSFRSARSSLRTTSQVAGGAPGPSQQPSAGTDREVTPRPQADAVGTGVPEGLPSESLSESVAPGPA